MIRNSPSKRQWKNDIKRPRLEGLEVKSPSKNKKPVPNDVWENDFFSNSDVLQDLEILSQNFERTAIGLPNADENGNKGNEGQAAPSATTDHSECQKEIETKSGEITYLRKKIEALNETIKQKDKELLAKISENQIQGAKINSLKISSHTPKSGTTVVAPLSKPSTSKDLQSTSALLPEFPSLHNVNVSPNDDKKQLTHLDPSEFVLQSGKILKEMKLDHLLSFTAFLSEDDDDDDRAIFSVIPDIKSNLYNLYILDAFDNDEAKLVIKKILKTYQTILSSLIKKFEKRKIKRDKKYLLKPEFINKLKLDAKYRLKCDIWFDVEENAGVRILLAILISISLLEASVLDSSLQVMSENRFDAILDNNKCDEILPDDNSPTSLQIYSILNFIRIQKTSYQNAGLLCAIIKLCTVMCATIADRNRDLLISKYMEQIVFSCPPAVVLNRLLKLLINACKYEPKIISSLCRNSAADSFVDNDSYFQFTTCLSLSIEKAVRVVFLQFCRGGSFLQQRTKELMSNCDGVAASCVLQVFCVEIEFIKFRSVKFLENFSKFVKCILHFEKHILWLHHMDDDGENNCECLDRFEQIIVTLSLDAVDRINSYADDRGKLHNILVDTVDNLKVIQCMDHFFLTRVAAYNGDYVCLLNQLKRIFGKNQNISEFVRKQLQNLRGLPQENSQQMKLD